MENIIQQTEAFLTKIYEKITADITDVDKLSSDVLEACKDLSRNIVVEVIEEMNRKLRENKQDRQELGLILKEKNRERELYTEIGTLKYRRDYYYNRRSGRYETPIDEMIGVRKYERVGDSVRARLVTMATEVSYARSAEIVSEGKLSRQTVRNCILSAPSLEKKPENATTKRQLKILDIYADEDHAHMQKPNKQKGKRNKMVPLVTVTEGKTQLCKGRKATISPMHFVDEKMNSDNLWESVEGYIASTYDMEAIEKIYIHADGGKWIQRGLENFNNIEHVMDGYHLKKRIRDINLKFPKGNIGSRLEIAIKEGDLTLAEAVLQDSVKWCKSSKDIGEISKMLTYIKRNWTAITNRYKEGISGSCTEGQVSHVLSKRFSRNPMGWSEEGLGKLTKLRVFCKNGGKIKAEHFKEDYKQDKLYKTIAQEYLKKPEGRYDFSWMNDMKEQYIFDTSNATQYAIRNLGRLRNNLIS